MAKKSACFLFVWSKTFFSVFAYMCNGVKAWGQAMSVTCARVWWLQQQQFCLQIDEEGAGFIQFIALLSVDTWPAHGPDDAEWDSCKGQLLQVLPLQYQEQTLQSSQLIYQNLYTTQFNTFICNAINIPILRFYTQLHQNLIRLMSLMSKDKRGHGVYLRSAPRSLVGCTRRQGTFSFSSLSLSEPVL